MATLIGREAWHIGGALFHGVIVEHNKELNSVKLNCGISDGTHWFHLGTTTWIKEKALKMAEESAEYWERQVARLRRELENEEQP